MLRNYLVTALRNLERNRLYAVISILGLTVAFTAAILIAQFVRNEFSYDRWIPGYERVYQVMDFTLQPGQAPMASDSATAGVAGRLKAGLPEAIAVARLKGDPAPVRGGTNGPAAIERSFAWTDPEIFTVLPLPVLAGNLQTALEQPDTVVLTRRMARKYFGRDLPIGEFLQIKADATAPFKNPPLALENIPWRSMRVTAVLKDLPANTSLTTEIFASGRTAGSMMAVLDHTPPGFLNNFTFVRLSPKASASDLQRALDVAGQPDTQVYAAIGARFSLRPVPLPEVHLTALTNTVETAKPVGSRGNAYVVSAVAALIVLVAAINFVTLLTARATRRAMEVGVRKATGAGRAHLMIQFTAETLIQAAFSSIVALALAELLIKPFGAFTQRELTIDFLHDPVLLAGIASGALVVGLLAAVYPALVLSRFRPAAVLKGGPIQMVGSARARHVLVVVQFAVLLGLIVTTTTLYRQTQFALSRGLGGSDGDKILQIDGACAGAFRDEVRKLPGVSATACSSPNALNSPSAKNTAAAQVPGGQQQNFDMAPVDFGFFEVYGLKPLAGRDFSPRFGQDGVLGDPKYSGPFPVIVNEAAVRQLGFADPRAAIGHVLRASQGPPNHLIVTSSPIVGVVSDMPRSVRRTTDPTFYFVVPQKLSVLSIRLTGRDVIGTVRAIDAAWKRTGHTLPMREKVMSQIGISLYLDLIIQSATIGICAGLAILLACLGLFALAAYTTERRTKEIGVRKAMGADTLQVVLLLLWQFTIPVLVATAIAIPAGVFAMNWWLHGFAYHVGLSAWTFVLAAVAAVGTAWLTVAYQSFMVARAKPVSALRCE
jgi:putative ABC transport system permease protein